MLLLSKKTRDNLVQILKSQIVPAETGFNLVQIVRVLEGLEELEEEGVQGDKEEKTDEN